MAPHAHAHIQSIARLVSGRNTVRADYDDTSHHSSDTTRRSEPGRCQTNLATTRRVNTAERRATHNVVERQCRETLNGRFLDLASLLSNLYQIHRPSKSAIVNSSIAYLNASCRHRIPAAQQLRAMKNEAHALRHELNEWRARAGVAFIEEPIRGDAFGASWKGGAYAGTHYAPEPTDEYAHAHLQRQQPEHAEMPAQAQLQQAAFGHAAAVGHGLPPQGRHPQPIIIPPPQPSPVPRSRRSTIPQQAARSRPAGILVNTPASNHNETP
ncbi:hypothetical protein K438DRAFT_1968391 [Mycena galopus ATCC 62051]|nr:hypothetical protein K438DRAFT_1968391 [Mycena galopus ATCC 62051]